jgi:hypothetical protein
MYADSKRDVAFKVEEPLLLRDNSRDSDPSLRFGIRTSSG